MYVHQTKGTPRREHVVAKISEDQWDLSSTALS